MRHTVGAGIFLAGIAVALACSQSTSPLELAGTYSLTSVNGSPLPFLLPSTGATQVELLSDSYSLTPGGTYSEAGYKRFTTGGGVSFSYPVDAGHFTRLGDEIKLQSMLFSARVGTIRNGALTVIDQNLTLVYKK
jgi:hypothetical protein